MLITEIILENFMSYEYARIPLKKGVNLICGPNGSGKSSILLGISVALGQSYTERSKRLSDLIRWGKDIARVTLSLNNSKVGGRRPIPKINKDRIYLTRVLRRDGKYWFEIDNAAASKSDVQRLLSRFNVDPDNMLIIMHQDMAEQFVILPPQEKLKLVESAVGLEPYRRNVLEAQSKLSRIISQEESLNKMLESAEQTLSYWREQYERYQEKKQLILKRRFLERELAWAEVARKEEEVAKIRKEIDGKRTSLEKIEDLIKAQENSAESLQKDILRLKDAWQRLLEERISLEKEKARYDLNILRSDEMDRLKGLLEDGEKSVENLSKIAFLIGGEGIKSDGTYMSDRNLDFTKIIEDINHCFNSLKSRVVELEELISISNIKLANLEVKLLDVKDGMWKTSNEIDELTNRFIEKRVDLAVLRYQRDEASKELEALNSDLNRLLLDLEESIKRAEESGPRIAVLRSPEEVLDEIRITDGRLSAMVDVSEDMERMYESYSKLYFELKEKARIAAENREKTLEEIKVRMEAWRTVINNLLNSINTEYRQNILSRVAATGFVRLMNEHNIEAAGLEIHVGFKGSQPIPLNVYSQSGGERSTATMAFLLALQRHIKSPFRAIDEYDVHMDPRNREVIANILISAIEDEDAQYLAITPNQMFFEGKNVHIITVQNVEGKSLIREVA